ncbi:hypothetical protein CGLAR1_00490 [Corynebacterium glutamicum]|uniref:Uncharacterized protein n=1 Tax=Corynebacterium glutamicum TaxID=1718 RepID=A0AB36IGE3_CORGT|nr:hypothetical protein [Corynebacterium glutamicum]AGN18155.1 hypothetical protein C624_02840 [Corynebacterium glutamicum SCgG1]AGN21178.1 hypothetical protein C629_02840 [Corynebacterium glutamicum SCgG2]AIK83777.1 hypothetical protein CGLAR1_00435 [Corynebacterium glutamicum]AIK83786.1 hypothetical protein CGLAR1_00490 [Corynebacterium glutamicum]AIK86537.1 hypothetical protein AR0_00435 [Corynebacterium glutamicum]
MTFTTKYQNWPEASVVDLSDIALEGDALDAASVLTPVVGFLRLLEGLDLDTSRDWRATADELENVINDLRDLAADMLARQQQEELR